MEIDIGNLELRFLGKNTHEIRKKLGEPDSIHMMSDTSNKMKKFIYKDFITQFRNDVCIRISKRVRSN